MNHLVTLLLIIRGVFQYVRFAWSVRTVTGSLVATRWGHQCVRALMTASNLHS